MVRNAAAAPSGVASRLQAPAENDPARGRAPYRLAPGLQGRHTRVQQLRVRRATDGIHPPRHAGASLAQGGEVGRLWHEGHQRTGYAAVYRWELPQRVGAADLIAAANPYSVRKATS